MSRVAYASEKEKVASNDLTLFNITKVLKKFFTIAQQTRGVHI